VSFVGNSDWYQLFSRGARDWLRHNDKVREAVRQQLPGLIAGSDVMSGTPGSKIQVPVRLLEHARFRLAEGRSQAGAGQGAGEAGDVLRPADPDLSNEAGHAGGAGQGALQLMLEFSVEELVDWIWEEFNLPELEAAREGALVEPELVRTGWDKRGVPSRLDRRRTMKEAIKRRAVQEHGLALTNDDLRFRQVAARPRPITSAAVLFIIDVSASMREAERTLAKSFFFFALQGLKRRYGSVVTRFIAHTTEAWEFSEQDFFRVSGSGGTIASRAFLLAQQMIRTELAAAHKNIYLFYASDGENFNEDRQAAKHSLSELASTLNYIGYLETQPAMPHALDTEMRRLCTELERRQFAIRSCLLAGQEDVWRALRMFFSHDGMRLSDQEHV
jgi:uncharacterized sporulation protein YeaH/YhbH (DUF444 family)